MLPDAAGHAQPVHVEHADQVIASLLGAYHRLRRVDRSEAPHVRALANLVESLVEAGIADAGTLQVERQIGGKTLSISTGTYAKLADGAVTVQYGETVVFAAVVRERKDAVFVATKAGLRRPRGWKDGAFRQRRYFANLVPPTLRRVFPGLRPARRRFPHLW